MVTGNGRDTLEILIFRHPRAIVLLSTFLNRFEDRLDQVPEEGEIILLGELGTHARGAIFRDGRHLITQELTEAVDAIALSWEGFYFGRFDFKVPDEEALREGRALKILELNGLTSEETHIYDARHSLFFAWRTLCRQWRTAFEIGEANVRAGLRPPSIRSFLGDCFKALRRQRSLK